MRLNKVCELEDWSRIEELADVPRHRKYWERVQLMRGLRCLGALRPDAFVLAVGAGHEPPVYELTNSVRWVFCTDLYGSTGFGEADAAMLRDPDAFAIQPSNRRRLVVQHMNALDLRYEDESFDAVFSLSSIEHVGGFDAAKTAIREMTRVLKPLGVLGIATELIVNGMPHFSAPHLELFTPDTFVELLNSATPGSICEPMDFTVSPATIQTALSMDEALRQTGEKRLQLPHVVVSIGTIQFTSAFAFLRKG